MPHAVIVLPYDPVWPQRFRQERAILDALFRGCAASIEHIGSTAVPGLGAKPVIDVMVGVARLEDAERRVGALEREGYEYVPGYEREIPGRRYFRKPRVGVRAFHLHCVVEGSEIWVRHLAFRDALRAQPELAAAYYALKCELAARCGKDEYTEAKGPFIEAVLAAAPGGDPSGTDRRLAENGEW